MLSTLAINQPALGNRRLLSVQICDITLRHTVLLRSSSSQLSRLPGKISPRSAIGLVCRGSKIVADGAKTVLFANVDEFELPDEHWPGRGDASDLRVIRRRA